LQASRLNLTAKLKAEGRGTTGSGEQARTRRVLVVTEFALSLVLMIAAGFCCVVSGTCSTWSWGSIRRM
jgi:hypothetical protein